MTATASPLESSAASTQLTGRSSDVRGLAFHVVLLLALLFSLGVLATLVLSVLAGGLPVFAERGLSFLTSPTSANPDKAGVVKGIVGSVLLTIIVAVVAIPLGIMTAVYLEEYAPASRLSRFIDINIRNLAGVPSIVYGLLGFTVFVTLMAPITGGTTIISAGLTLAVLVLPIVIIASAEAIRAVPHELREGGYGIGGSRWQVVRELVLPAAMPGIMTGTILALARAIGETAPLLLVGAVLGFFSSGNQSPLEQLFGKFTALPTLIYDWARRPQSEFRELTSAAIIVLLVITLFATAVSIILRNKYRRTW
jgi:phosphate transport system permease protein